MFFFFAWWNRYKLYHDFICVDSVPIFVAYLSKEIHSSQRCFSDFLEWLIWESFGISISVLLQVAILNPSKSKVLEAKFCIFANCPTNSPLFDSGKTGPRPQFLWPTKTTLTPPPGLKGGEVREDGLKLLELYLSRLGSKQVLTQGKRMRPWMGWWWKKVQFHGDFMELNMGA